MSQLDRHLTTEELSALLDNQLASEEADDEYREHLTACQQCQHELSELRQTVQLLHALPQPVLPRSFVLPADLSQTVTEMTSETENPGEPNIHVLRSTNNTRRRSPARRSMGRRVFSLLGTLAAVVGILFVLSGFVPTQTQMAVSTASTGSASSAASSANAGAQTNGASSASSTSAGSASSGGHALNPAASGNGGPNDGTPGAEPTPGLQPEQVPASQPPKSASGIQAAPGQEAEQSAARAPVIPSLLDISATGVRIALGILLFIAGAMGIAVGRDRRKEIDS